MAKTPNNFTAPICPRHDPPMVMIETETEGLFVCARCGNDKDCRPHHPVTLLKETRLSQARRVRRGV